MNRGLETTIGAPQSDVSDHLLLNRYSRSRAPEPFLELVRRHTGLVYGTCLRITANVHDAEELTQECFFDLARQANEIRTSLVGWLHQAATHRALNRLRGERRRRLHEQGAGLERVNVTSEPNGTSDDLSWSEIAPLVDQALAELPEELRTPILMHYLAGTTQAEVANSLGVHQSTVSRRLSEGIETLRETLWRAGLVVPMTVLVSWFAAQSATAAPPTLAASIGKIGLAGVGTSTAANAAGSSLMAWLAGIAHGAVAFLFVPLVAGILWGDVVFLLALVAWCGYLGLRRPEWVRVLCFTRQFPNIFEWPFFPFARWTWQTPPREWRIWVAFYLVLGAEFLGLVALPVSLPKRFVLLLLAAAVWHFFMGVRIWRRVRRCRMEFPTSASEAEVPIDGALLLTYALAGVALIAKLCAAPWFLSQPTNQTAIFWLNLACVVFWATVLIWGAFLVFGRYRRWREQGVIEPVVTQRINDLAPPRWLLTTLMLIPMAVAFLITFATLVHDLFPIYVPYGDDPVAIARRTMFVLTLSAMDFVVIAILPLAYLYRRIPRIAWGVAFGLIGLLGTLHLGLFTKTIIAAPILAAPPEYAPLPRMDLSKGHFVVANPPNLLANDSLRPNVEYLGASKSLSVRFASGETIAVEYDGHKAQLSIPKNDDPKEQEVAVVVMASPHDFQKGVPSRIKISLIVVHSASGMQKLEQFRLPLPADISPADWKNQIEFGEQELEREYPLSETVILGSVRGKSLTLTVVADQTTSEPAR